MADWKNVHLAEEDAKISALHTQIKKLEAELARERSGARDIPTIAYMSGAADWKARATRAEAERDELRSRLSGDVPIGVYAALAGIRSALGVHERPMLDELEGIVRSVVTERDEARGRCQNLFDHTKKMLEVFRVGVETLRKEIPSARSRQEAEDGRDILQVFEELAKITYAALAECGEGSK